MKTVQQILEGKIHKTLSVSPDASVYDALQLMAGKDVGALVVLNKDQLVGIFTERDYARKVALQGKASKETLVKEVMTSKVLCVNPLQTMDECMALMTDKRVRHLPVIEQNKVVGVISIGDVVKEVIADQQFQIHQLEQYIHM
jgi:CBS domain-containing protein